MSDNFSCTHCGRRYDFHPGVCSGCGQNTVIFDGRGDGAREREAQAERDRERARERRDADARQAQQAKGAKTAPPTSNAKASGSASTGSGCGGGIVGLGIIAVVLFIFSQRGGTPTSAPGAAATGGSTPEAAAPASSPATLGVVPFRRNADETPAQADARFAEAEERARSWVFDSAGNPGYDRYTLINRCDIPVYVAAHYFSVTGQWVTRGWWTLAPYDSLEPRFYPTGRTVYLHGFNGQTGHVWPGETHRDLERPVIRDAPFALGAEEAGTGQRAWFHARTVTGPYGVVRHEFTCGA